MQTDGSGLRNHDGRGAFTTCCSCNSPLRTLHLNALANRTIQISFVKLPFRIFRTFCVFFSFFPFFSFFFFKIVETVVSPINIPNNKTPVKSSVCDLTFRNTRSLRRRWTVTRTRRKKKKKKRKKEDAMGRDIGKDERAFYPRFT